MTGSVSRQRSPGPRGTGEVGSTKNWNSLISCFSTRVRVGGFQSRTSGPHVSTRNRETFVDLYFGKWIWVESRLSLGVPVIAYILFFGIGFLKNKFKFPISF